jgi:hypothetical protein
MPRKTILQKAQAEARSARRSGANALKQASEALPAVVAMYKEAINSSDKYAKIQGAQGLERLAARYDQLDIGSAGVVTVVFSSGVPKLGEPAEDEEAVAGSV